MLGGTRSGLAAVLAISAVTTALAFTSSATVAAAAAPPAQVFSVQTPAGLKLIHPQPGPAAPGAGTELYLHSTATQGVIAVKPKVYLVFWGSQWSSDPAKAATALQAFFKGLDGSKDRWGMVLDQYCQGLKVKTVNCGTAGTHVQHPTTTPLAGVWFDNAHAEPSHATATQLAAEAATASTHFGNTTQASNLNTQYVIASPHGAHPDGFPASGFCAWHNSASTSDGHIAFTNLPYVPDLGAGGCTTIGAPTALDGYFSTETHEYAETVTDLWPSRGWLDSGGAEIGDKCQALDARQTITTGTFDVQGIWSNTAVRCVTS